MLHSGKKITKYLRNLAFSIPRRANFVFFIWLSVIACMVILNELIKSISVRRGGDGFIPN